MHAATWSSQTTLPSAVDIERIIAWTCVACVHLLLVWIGTRPSSKAHAESRPPMQLVFILPRPDSAPSTGPVRTQRTAPVSRAANRLELRPDLGIDTQAPRESTRARRIEITTADDRWDMPTRARHDEPSAIAQANPMQRYNPIQMGAPGRFRMRRQITPADIVRAVSMELFWPPGYTDDPCPGIDKAVRTLTAGSTARDHQLLQDAVLLQARYCS